MEKESQRKKRVAIYTRVSSDEQKKEGLSLDAQKKKLEEYAEFKEWFVFKIYTDAGISGSSIKIRKAFKEMLEDAKAEKFSAILITKFDRAFRNVIDALTTIDELHKIGVDIVSISENIDTTTAMGRAFFTITQAFAELEAKKTGERVNDILRYKFNKGLLIGKAPIGYKWNKQQKKFLMDPKKAEMVKDIFLMKSQGKYYKEICDKYRIGITTYYNILKNKAYIGIVEYNGQTKKGIHDPLIDEETFNKCQIINIR